MTEVLARGVILFSHGSRDPLWSAPILAVQAHLQAQQPGLPVLSAYLEINTPTLEQAVQTLSDQGVRHITVVPMFLGTGKHARDDLPRLMTDIRAQHAQLQFQLQTSIGEDPRMTELMALIAGEAVTSNGS